MLFDRTNVAVRAGANYTLSFRARADRPLSIQADVWQATSPWADYMHSNEIPLTSEWRTFELPMTSSGTNAAAVMGFSMGGAVGTIWIDDVKLQEGTRGAYRRDFEGGVALVNPTDAAVTVDLGGSFRKIKGTQAPAVNDGSLVTAVTIPAKDGLVLLHEAPAPITEPVANDDAYATSSATTLTVSAPGVLGNDAAPDGRTMSASTVTTSDQRHAVPERRRVLHLRAERRLLGRRLLYVSRLRRHRLLAIGDCQDHRGRPRRRHTGRRLRSQLLRRSSTSRSSSA